MIKKEDCAHFIEQLLGIAASLHPENKLISDEIAGLFELVTNGGGFYVAPTASYSTVGGDILNGTGAVYIRAQPQFLPDPRIRSSFTSLRRNTNCCYRKRISI